MESHRDMSRNPDHAAVSHWPAQSPVLTDGVVLLRAPRADDIDDITRGAADPEVQRYTTVPSPYLREHAEWFVDHFGGASWGIAEPFGIDGGGPALLQAAFAITEVPDDQFLGAVGLHNVDLEAASGEVGYWMSPGSRGRGLMTRTLGLVLAWAFDEVGLSAVSWEAMVGNDSSRSVAEAHGFEIDGTGVCTNGAGLESPAWTATLTAQKFRDHRAG